MININNVNCEFLWNSISEEIVSTEEIKEKWNLMSFNERLRYSTTEEKLVIDNIDISLMLEVIIDKIEYELDLFETDFAEEMINDSNQETLKQAIENMIKNKNYYVKDEDIDPKSELKGTEK